MAQTAHCHSLDRHSRNFVMRPSETMPASLSNRNDGIMLPSPGGQRLLLGLTTFGIISMLCWLVLRSTPLVDIETPPPGSIQFSLDINTAPAREIALLPGIGPTMAARIVADRAKHGPFASLEEITRVPGIGPVTLAQIRPSLRTLRPPPEALQQ